MSFVHDIAELVAVQSGGLLAVADHWERAPLRRVAEVINGYPFPSSGFNSERGEQVIRIRDILRGVTESRFDGVVDVAPRAKPGDLVIGMDGDFNSVLWPGEVALLNQRVCKVDVDERLYSKRFLAYVLPAYLKLINDHTSAITVKHLSSSTVQEIPLPLPPRTEQDRIVSRLDELFSEIDEGERALERVQKLVERYRQSVLKAAVTGELTREWRTQRGREAPTQTSAADSAAATVVGLPDSWQAVPLPELGEFGRGKSKHRPRNDPKLFGGPYPFLQTGTVRASKGRITDFDSTYSELGLAQSKLWPKGTVCITIAANIAASGVLAFEACFPDSVVGLVPAPGVSGEYIEYFVRTARESLDRYAPATAQKNINLDILEKVRVPLPPPDEQLIVCSRVREVLSTVDALERTLDEGRLQAQALRQTILKAAFSGQLVPQDPTDEPASALLARLAKQAGEAQNATQRKGRRVRTATP